MKEIIITKRYASRNPKCRICGKTFKVGEKAVAVKNNHKGRNALFCKDCWRKPILVYPLKANWKRN